MFTQHNIFLFSVRCGPSYVESPKGDESLRQIWVGGCSMKFVSEGDFCWPGAYPFSSVESVWLQDVSLQCNSTGHSINGLTNRCIMMLRVVILISQENKTYCLSKHILIFKLDKRLIMKTKTKVNRVFSSISLSMWSKDVYTKSNMLKPR